MDFFKSDKYKGAKLSVVLLFTVIYSMLRLSSQTTLSYVAILVANLLLIIYLFINISVHKNEPNRNWRIANLVIASILFICLLLIV
jgi:4-hydroxybenzoate polyprenyltransferase